ncbi:beta-lactamase/transpeptidase-like protein [Aspergillus germanicus]
MAQVQGHCDERFKLLRTLMENFIDSGDECGASLTVNIDGENVVDIWGGYMDETRTRAWESDTIANMWSTTKNISSLAALVLVDRGLVHLREKVSKYWPEFAANGKQDIEVRHVISHTSGLAAWEKPVTVEDLYDTEASTAKLAAQAPWWTPGVASGYHSYTHGHLIAELVRRTTGKSLKEFVADELAIPLGADFQYGAVEGDFSRIASIIPPPPKLSSLKAVAPPPPPPSGSVMAKATGAPTTDPIVSASPAWRKAQLGGANGHGNGRSVARMLSPVSLGGSVDNGTIHILFPGTIDEIFQEQAYGEDLVVGTRLRFGTGFGLPAKDTYWDWVPVKGRICGWGGWGGSMGIMDLDRRMTIGYVMNKMHDVGMGSPCTKAYVAEIYRVLGVEC